MKRPLVINRALLYVCTIIADAVVLLLADVYAYILCFGNIFYNTPYFTGYIKIAVLVIVFKILCLYTFKSYDKPKYKSDFVILICIVKAMSFAVLITAVAAYFFDVKIMPRPVVIISYTVSIMALTFWRVFIKSAAERILGKDFFKFPILIVGTDDIARQAAMFLLNNAAINYKILGFVETEEVALCSEMLGYPVIGHLKDMNKIASHYPIKEVLIASSKIDDQRMSRILAAFKGKRHVIFTIVPSIYGDVVCKIKVPERGLPFVSAASPQQVPVWYLALKRILDTVLSLMLLVLMIPLFIVIAILIKTTSSGPVFYVTKRIGYSGKLFVMYKFRSMREWASHRRVERWARSSTERATPIGPFLRRYRLDELPQLVNVLKNDMSLIGPRPETRYYVNRLLKDIPLYSERFKIKPGITGWAQVNLGYVASVENSKQKLIYDIYYLQNQSLGLDLLIALKTIKAIFAGTGVI